MTTAVGSIISEKIEEEFMFDLELDFADFRGQISLLGIEASGVVAEMFLPLGGVEEVVDAEVIEVEVDVIDIEAIELEAFDLTVASAAEASALELLEAFDLTIASIEEAGALVFDFEPVAA